MRRGVITILLIVLLLVLPIVFSEEVQSTFDEAKSYSWLKTATQNWDSLSIQDASLAILAFNNNGDDVSVGVSNLIARGDPVGCWTKDFTVEGNKVNDNWWIDVEKDLQSDLIKTSVSEKLDVNCGALSGALIISLLYKSGNNFFILEQHSESRATLTINNGCYGETSTSSGCHYISTMYASWALTELEEEIATRDYLESPVANDGYWNNNVGDTAMALIALHGRDLERASGSFSSIATNATTTSEPEDCVNGVDDDDDGLADCFDGDCVDHSSCAEETATEEECGNGVCDLGEDSEICPSDCQDNEKCNDKGECVKKFPWGIILTILIIILVLGGGAVFYLRFVKTGKLFKPKGSKPRPSFERYSMERPIQQPMRTAAQPSKKSKEEDELEKSLKEAEKLLYGKK